MNSKTFPFYVAFYASILVAITLNIFPMPFGFSWLRPEFVALVILYWVLNAPQHVGVGYAWVIGLLQDLIEGNIWGAHALALSLIAYFCLSAYQRLRSYSFAQQCLWIFILIGLHQIFASWVQGLGGQRSPIYLVLLSTIVSALCWPLFVILMQGVKRYARIVYE